MITGNQVVIRDALTPDVEFIRTLSQEAFGQYGPYETLLPEWFLAGITLTYVAVQDKAPVGFGMLGIIDRDPSSIRESELLAIAVAPTAQRRGIGTRLMRKMRNAAHARHVENIILHTAMDNLPARKLFEKFGFVGVGHKAGFYPNGQDAMMMAAPVDGKNINSG